jgi:hypothetical protein
MKRRLFTGLAAATALAASIMITSGAAASAQDASVATAADTQSAETYVFGSPVVACRGAA